MKRINYKAFIEDNFLIIDKEGKIVPFIFNDTQNYYWELLKREYPLLQGIRENILKFRQPGFSSLIDAIFTVDFIRAEEGKTPIVFADIYSHKDEETKKLFQRVSFFLDSFFNKYKINRKLFLEEDTQGYIKGRRNSDITVNTANAKVSGRGGTKQNMHFSEPAFYPNTDILNANDLVLGAEQQVADGIGKIFRESTGNMIGDFFNEEYEFGKLPGSKFKSRFLGWWLHKEYTMTPPAGWVMPDKYKKLNREHGAGPEQCYWHFWKINSAKPADREKLAREYPCDDIEAFLQQGKLYFNVEALRYYKDIVKRDEMVEGRMYV
jgi:hypothetical protein